MVYAPFDLTGKSCVVTGGSRGIGFAIAEALAAAGANVAIWSDSRERLMEAADKLRSRETEVLAQVVDVRSRDQVTAGMEELKLRTWHIDAVFACAGTPQPMLKLVDTPDEVYREMFAVHMDGTYWTLKQACLQFISQAEAGRPGGAIIAISSLAADFGAARLHAYAAAKGGIAALVRSIAVEMGRYRVRANTIVPGWIETDLSSSLREVAADKALKRIPARRWGQPEELGGIAVYLASDASSYHSGDTIVVDGGYSVA